MRGPSSLVVLSLLGLAVGCSRSKPAVNRLDLALPDIGRRTPVASALELGAEAKAEPAAPARKGADAPLHAHRNRPNHRPAPHLQPTRRGPERVPVLAGDPVPTIVPAPIPTSAPAPVAAAAPAPTSEPTADPAPSHGGGWGGWSEPGGGARIPGFPGGGVIIIRGGHGGMDPCDEHGHGIGRGFPGFPGRGGRGFPGGGIVFIRIR